MAAVLDPCMNTFTSTYLPHITSSSTYAHIFYIGRTHPLAMIRAYETKTNDVLNHNMLETFKYTSDEIAAVDRAYKALTRWRAQKTGKETSDDIGPLLEKERERVIRSTELATGKEPTEADKRSEGEVEERGQTLRRETARERAVKEAKELFETLTSPAKFSDGAQSIVSCWEIQD